MQPVMDAGLLQQELRPLLIILRGRASSRQLLLMRPAGKGLALSPSDNFSCLMCAAACIAPLQSICTLDI